MCDLAARVLFVPFELPVGILLSLMGGPFFLWLLFRQRGRAADMMELCHITAGYGGPPVLRDVSLAFEPGKVTVLAGPNGCGKSTLLRVAARLMAPERGEVRIEGQDVSRLSAKQFARLAALLPQSRPLPGITAGSLVLHGRFPYLGYPRRYSREDREAARQAMERTGVAGLEGVPMAHLSGGQRQKVYLAMALAQDTPVLLLDEPTTFLDIAHQLELAETARTLAGREKRWSWSSMT